jgi:hypothetical protein
VHALRKIAAKLIACSPDIAGNNLVNPAASIGTVIGMRLWATAAYGFRHWC